MFGKRKKAEPALDKAIDKVLDEMKTFGPDCDEYTIMLGHLEKLYRIKAEQAKPRINSDTWAIVAGNLLGILIIVSYEHAHVVVSKGLGFVTKARVPNY